MIVPIVPDPDSESCCTCASLLHNVPQTAPGSEKPLPFPRRLPCCNRIICGSCLHSNARFASYCPYCQTSTPSLPPRLKSPPPTLPPDSPPPPYRHSPSPPPSKAEADSQPQDVLHFLDHEHDTIPSLSLRYNVPAPVLRRANNLTSDHLLAARRTVLIPASHYSGGTSLSPRPIAGELDERRKAAVRRFMVTCKVADYDVATLYLEQAGHDLHAAVEQYLGDDAWERAHPKGKGKAKAESSRRGLFRW
ncbi:hypothetical protein B0T11DRAFT_3066 [Plectosphaerella cucumerina]|uniref:LysM domain-containing protein n=1 Tax=Plectosphaerella cucumerina TaxID=40658 RepID=A0A8K0TQS3_9PEZI|nr:hypothetical protein B0T11DRAFT_3066 [Plectosphaerella cucumerina]